MNKLEISGMKIIKIVQSFNSLPSIPYLIPISWVCDHPRTLCNSYSDHSTMQMNHHSSGRNYQSSIAYSRHPQHHLGYRRLYRWWGARRYGSRTSEYRNRTDRWRHFHSAGAPNGGYAGLYPSHVWRIPASNTTHWDRVSWTSVARSPAASTRSTGGGMLRGSRIRPSCTTTRGWSPVASWWASWYPSWRIPPHRSSYSTAAYCSPCLP